MIRRIEPADVAAATGLVHELAEYEKAPHECSLTEPQLTTALFGDTPALFGHVAVENGAVVGTALWFLNFSTWDGVHGIYLEDLYVQPEHRGRGHGKALLAALARECVERGYSRLAWSVLTWNTPSIEFYESLGADAQSEWLGYRLSGEGLARLAANS
ncbi:GNAT family N-acetyltransferase [Rhodococcus triatomae]|nr:acetyltransferase [Rhodococcus triatomae BKS 15-14]